MDRIKVRKGLEEAICVMDAHVPERYWGYARQACRDAIDLLKEQPELVHCSECARRDGE